MADISFDMSFYKGKKVLITGHTGFKGSWMTVMLQNAGAEIIGYSTCSKTETRLFDLCGVKDGITHIKGDVRDLPHLLEVFEKYRPEIVIHMAAQPLVRESYDDPVGTYATNVMGTVNICEAVRKSPFVRSFLNVTTDKVYDNREWEWGYRETDPLDGFDPYSNSKSCSELVTHCYTRSFFAGSDTAVSTARAGNVIGGGDFAKDRIIPDCVRAAVSGNSIIVRNPASVRPFQHVLEAVYAYLMIAACQYSDRSHAGNYNVGPNDDDCLCAGDLVLLFAEQWGGLGIEFGNAGGPHEAGYLKLDHSRISSVFGWKPRLTIKDAVRMTVEWSKVWAAGENVRPIMDKQIKEYRGEI